jgi:hypothetical protein
MHSGSQAPADLNAARGGACPDIDRQHRRTDAQPTDPQGTGDPQQVVPAFDQGNAVITNVPNNRLPKGSSLNISLVTDPSSHGVTAATFTVQLAGAGPQSHTVNFPASIQFVDRQNRPGVVDAQFPIGGFQVDLIGPDGSNAVFTSGAGILTYSVSPGTLTVQQGPVGSNCGQYAGAVTGETSNVMYSTVTPSSGATLTQDVGVIAPPRPSGATWVTPSADGRMEMFFVAIDLINNGSMWHQWQTAPNNGWSGWENTFDFPSGTQGFRTPPTVGTNADGRLEFFATTTDGTLWHRWQTAPSNGWSDYDSLAAPPTGGNALSVTPAVASNLDGRLELFIVGADSALWHRWQTAPNNGWSDWSSLDAPSGVELVHLPPTLAPNADGRLELFIIGSDGTLWHLWQTTPNNGWSSWETMGSPAQAGFSQTSIPAVGRSADGRFDLFAVGTDGALWHRYQTAVANGWSGDWETMGTPPSDTFDQQSTPAIGPDVDGRLELFAMGSSGTLYHRWQTAASNGWSDWETFSLAMFPPAAVPALAGNADGRLEMFLVATDGTVAHIWQTAASNGWSGWESLGKPEFAGFTVGWNP